MGTESGMGDVESRKKLRHRGAVYILKIGQENRLSDDACENLTPEC